MESRFTFKDFVFAVLILVVIGAVLWSSFQFSYQESRLNDVKTHIQTLDETQKQQVAILTDIRNQLRSGVTVGNAHPKAESKNIRRTNPDGSLYVEYPEPPRPPRDPTTRPDYAPGDWVVQNLDSEPKVLTPYCQKDYVGQLAQNPVLEALAGLNLETGELDPVLAESYEQSADGKTIRFKMRPNTCFSDGSPVTVEDVIFSFNTIMNPGVDCASLRSYFTNVTSCTKIDDRTVEFKLSEPYFLALEFIGGMAVIPKHVYNFTNPDDFNRKGDVLVGSGPYRVEKWERGQQLIMVRNERYWDERPTFDRLIFKFISNEQAAFQAFQNSQIDRFEPDGEQFAKFSTDPDFTKQFIAHKYLRVNSGYTFLGYNLKRPMFKDKKTRTALTMLIDRESAIKNLLKGMGEMTPGPFSPVNPQANPDLKPLPYDPEGAKKLLAEAGWKPGPDGVLVRDGVRFEFDLTMPANYPMGERIANYVKGQFESAGIRMRLTPWEFAVMNTRIDERNVDAVAMSWMGGGAEDDPTQIWHSKSIADKGSNFISFNNPESDKLLDEARITMSRAKRMEIWHKWEALIAEEQPYSFLWARPDRVFINGRFKNTEPYKLDIWPYDWYVPAPAQKYH